MRIGILQLPMPDLERQEIISKLAHELMDDLVKKQPDLVPSEVVFIFQLAYEAAATALAKRAVERQEKDEQRHGNN